MNSILREKHTRYIFENTPDMLSQGQFLESDGQSMKAFKSTFTDGTKVTKVHQSLTVFFTPIGLHFQLKNL